MKTVSLPCGRETLVSDIDFDLVRRHRWRVHLHNASRKPYVRAEIEGRNVLLHRFLVIPQLVAARAAEGLTELQVATALAGYKIDHVNNDTLDNRRENLRVASHYENNINRRFWTSTGFKGVSRAGLRFRARITVDGVETVIGRYDTAEDAARAYDARAFAQWGEFAYLNFRDEHPIRPSDETEIPF